MITPRRIALVLAVAAACAGFVWAGLERAPERSIATTDAAVEALVPADGSPVAVRQARIGIDLVPGLRADLEVQGVPIPPDQVQRNDALGQVFFQPGPDKVIEELAPGDVTATAYVWNPVEGETRDDARAITWRFRVA